MKIFVGNFFRKFFATLLMFVFWAVFLVTTFSFALYQTFFNEDFYKQDLVKASHDFLIHEGQKYIDFQPIADINKKDFTALLEKVILKEDLVMVVDNIVNQIENLTIGERGVVELKIPLKWLSAKSEIFSDQVVNYLFENLPKCEKVDEVYLREFNCIPEGLPKDDFSGSFKLALDRKLMSDLPDDFNFKFQVPDQFIGKNIGDFFSDLTGQAFMILGGALLLMLVVIGLLVFTPWSAVMKWVSKTVFLGSLSVILAAMFLNVFVPAIFDKLMKSIDMSVLNYNAWMSLYILFMGAFTINLLKIVFTIAIISLGFWITGMLFYRNKKSTLKNGDRATNSEYQELH